jgi:hypothetical protein
MCTTLGSHWLRHVIVTRYPIEAHSIHKEGRPVDMKRSAQHFARRKFHIGIRQINTEQDVIFTKGGA